MTMPFMRRTILGFCRRRAAFVRNDVLHSGVDERQFWQLARCMRLYLEGNLGRVVRISELAELNNVSIWHFTKSFQAIYGESPHVAATRIRMDHAARLLLETELAVSEVGMACGFENNCSFSRAFRASYGEPPSRFRLSSGPFRQMPQTCSTRVAKRQRRGPGNVSERLTHP
jgi:AraC-like DNA-binding protein